MLLSLYFSRKVLKCKYTPKGSGSSAAIQFGLNVRPFTVYLHTRHIYTHGTNSVHPNARILYFIGYKSNNPFADFNKLVWQTFI